MAATTKLIVYNAALREIGSQPLVDITTANTRLYELNGAWDHAIEHVLAMEDWGFARRRSALTGVADTSFPPYVYRYTKPADYLRKCWVKTAADDEAQVDHAEIAAVFYSMQSSALLEYVSDHADNYDPANWPPHFTKVLAMYLASLVAPKLARAGAGDEGKLDGKMQSALAEAREKEAVFLTNVAIESNRLPVMRRAIEFLGQQLAGSVAIHAHTDFLRWHMNRSWGHAVKYCLEQGAWNFATRRTMLATSNDAGPIVTTQPSGIFWFLPMLAATPTSSDSASVPDVLGWDYGYNLPSGFLSKIWIKMDANHDMECRHQFMNDAVYTSVTPVVLEYVAEDDVSTDPVNWKPSFLEAVAAYLALLVCPSLVVEVGSKGAIKVDANRLRDKLEGMFLHKLSDAKLRDAIQQEPKRPPPGRFVQARRGATNSVSLRQYN